MSQNQQNIPAEYQPISMWGYFGYEVLFSIPVVGFVFLIVFAAGGKRNKNVTNFARSYFCYLILMAVIFLVITAIAAAGGAAYELSDLFS